MFYVCEIEDFSRKTRVWKARDVAEYMQVGRVLCQKYHFDAPMDFDGMKQVLARPCAFYEIYDGDFEARDALHTGLLPEGIASRLRHELEAKRERESRRALLSGGPQ